MTTQARLNELSHAENPARELLERLGYTYVPREALASEREDERRVLLAGRLTAALMRLNAWMTEDQAQRVIFNLQHVDATGLARNQRIHEYLVYGLPLTIDRGGRQETPSVRFFDFDHPEPGAGLNEYVVTTQFRVRRGNERGGERTSEDDERVVKPDLVLFVNGIPLVVLEAKSPSLLEVWEAKAVRQLLRYQEAGPEWRGTGAPELFETNLMCVALCGTDAAYAAVGAPENAYVQWKSIEPFTAPEFARRFGVPPEGQARLIAGLLSPPTLLDVLRDFVVFEPERGRLTKKLPRYQQYRATRRAITRILDGRTPSERGGGVWHTQGSGKSLTMLYLATKLRRSPALRNPTIVIVTDRRQLDDQITRTFERTGFPNPEPACNTAHLRDLLRTTNGRTVMTTIQKFEEALSAPAGGLAHLNDADNVVVMIDEAHRTQYGLLAAKMRATLPNATFVGFTGTPIDQGFKRTTLGTFGELIDSYTIPQSVEDHATVPIYYEARLPDLHVAGPQTLDRLFDALFGDEPEETRAEIRRRYANKETIAEAAQRVQAVALDIAEHFKKKVQPNGFKAQVVAPSRAAALRYAEHSPDTRHRYFCEVRCFFNGLRAAGYTENDPFRGLRNVRLPQKIVPPFTPVEIQALLAGCNGGTPLGGARSRAPAHPARYGYPLCGGCAARPGRLRPGRAVSPRPPRDYNSCLCSLARAAALAGLRLSTYCSERYPGHQCSAFRDRTWWDAGGGSDEATADPRGIPSADVFSRARACRSGAGLSRGRHTASSSPSGS